MDNAELRFSTGDYAVFGSMLAVSLVIGIYYGVRDRRTEGVQNYMLGGRQMNLWSVGVSLSYTFVSAVTILGVPAEIYLFGSMYLWTAGIIPIVGPIVSEIYIPLYFRLGLTSCYEYLQLRFNRRVRLIGTAAYIAQTILFLGVMIYAPSLALSQVSGFNLWAAIFSTGLVCTIYTTLGGLKAVIWTDVFQAFVVIIVLLVSMFMGAESAGGWYAVWDANYRGGRYEFNKFDLDPRIRHSVWSLVIGLGFLWTANFATSQSTVQRYLACRNESDAKKALYLSLFASIFTVYLCCFIGWVMYAYFENCDPLSSRQVSAADQLLPLMVMQIFRHLPGLSGLFMAGVFAGCLSTVSSGINAMACVTVHDFIRPFVKWKESTLTIISKGLVFVYGLTSVGFACLSSLLGGVLQTSLVMLGMLGGPLLGMFTLGSVFPFANSLGSVTGFAVGLSLVAWIFVGSTSFPPGPHLLRRKALSVSGCGVATAASQVLNASTNYFTSYSSAYTVYAVDISTNHTTMSYELPTPIKPPPVLADLYSVSYAYYAPIGMGACIIVGIIVSLITCGHRHCADVDPKLIIPLLDHKVCKVLFPRSFRRKMWCGVQHEKKENIRMTQIRITQGHANEALDYNEEKNVADIRVMTEESH